MKKRYSALFASMMMFVTGGCQKGEEVVDTTPEIASVYIGNFNSTELELLSNGRPAFARSTILFKMFSGKNKLALVHKETLDTLFEQEFDIREKDTLFMLKPSAQVASLIRSSQSSEPPPPDGYIKVKILNFTSLAPTGQPVNLEFRQSIGYNWDTGEELFSDKTDTVFNVTASADNYVELAAPFIPDHGSFGGFRVTFLTADNQPLLKDGHPVQVFFPSEGTLLPDGSYLNSARIYTSILTDTDVYFADDSWRGQFVHLFLN